MCGGGSTAPMLREVSEPCRTVWSDRQDDAILKFSSPKHNIWERAGPQTSPLENGNILRGACCSGRSDRCSALCWREDRLPASCDGIREDFDCPFRTSGAPLGVDVRPDEEVLFIEEVGEGLVSHWNERHGDRNIMKGDCVVEVNGIHGQAQLLLDQCTAHMVLDLTVRRGFSLPVVPGSDGHRLQNPFSHGRVPGLM
mmetsp:Transcript_67042/g.175796  ORF Transcript_67042/g.175796 Transcript_67042/m.175796 type:complete len:198 (+) Transcript_67042:166-759(+)